MASGNITAGTIDTTSKGFAPRPGGIRIGQLLVEQGALTAAQVKHLLAVQKTTGRPFGELAERTYGVSPQAVEGAWVRQYVLNSPPIDPAAETIDPDCLVLLDRRQAWQFRVLPLHRAGEHLRLATTAGSLVRAVNFSVRHFDEPVDVFLAPEAAMKTALMRHYPVPAFLAEMAGAF